MLAKECDVSVSLCYRFEAFVYHDVSYLLPFEVVPLSYIYNNFYIIGHQVGQVVEISTSTSSVCSHNLP